MYIFRKKADFSFSIRHGIGKALQLTLCFMLASVLGIGLSASNGSETIPLKSNVPSYAYLTGDGVIITVIVDALSIETTSPSITISKIKIFDAESMEVYSENGCYTNYCTVNVQNLAAARYLIKVVTSDGKTHSKWVTIS